MNIERLHEQKYLNNREYISLTEIYSRRRSNLLHRCEALVKKSPTPHSAFLKITSLYALALEQCFAKELYAHGDITEKPLKKFLAILEIQAHRLRS